MSKVNDKYCVILLWKMFTLIVCSENTLYVYKWCLFNFHPMHGHFSYISLKEFESEFLYQ